MNYQHKDSLGNYKSKPASTIDQVIRAERFERKLEKIATGEVDCYERHIVELRVEKIIKTIEDYLAQGKYMVPVNVRRYVAQYYTYPPVRKYLDQIIAQLREAEFTKSVGRDLGMLLRLKKRADELISLGVNIEDGPLPACWERVNCAPIPVRRKVIVYRKEIRK